MAFSDTEKAKIRAYLGYGSRSQLAANFVDSYIESVMDEGVTQVQGYLVELDVIRAKVVGSAAGTAGIKSADSGGVEFFEGRKLSELKSIGRTLINMIAIVTQIPTEDDFFGSGCCGGAGDILNSGAF